jgi:hypothetical protein
MTIKQFYKPNSPGDLPTTMAGPVGHSQLLDSAVSKNNLSSQEASGKEGLGKSDLLKLKPSATKEVAKTGSGAAAVSNEEPNKTFEGNKVMETNKSVAVSSSPTTVSAKRGLDLNDETPMQKPTKRCPDLLPQRKTQESFQSAGLQRDLNWTSLPDWKL